MILNTKISITTKFKPNHNKKNRKKYNPNRIRPPILSTNHLINKLIRSCQHIPNFPNLASRIFNLL